MSNRKHRRPRKNDWWQRIITAAATGIAMGTLGWIQGVMEGNHERKQLSTELRQSEQDLNWLLDYAGFARKTNTTRK